MTRIIGHLRRNVYGLIAVFIVLGGTAYAALERNSVRSKHIVNGKVKSIDVKNNGLTGKDVNEARLGQVPSAGNADLLDGKDSSDFAAAGFDGTVFMGSSGRAVVGGTSFLSPSGNAGPTQREADSAALTPVAMVATDLAFKVNEPPGTGALWNLALRVNGVPTVLGCGIQGNDSACSVSIDVPIDAMDSISLMVEADREAPSAVVQFGWRAETP